MKPQASAQLKLQRISPRKARLVADQIRYESTSEALSILNNSNKKASRLFLKLLNSAIANAINTKGMDPDKLFISEMLVNEGPTLKRFQPRAQGRAFPILKRTSHFVIKLEEK
ncbi:MAG: 50S ribosomal protein L22 [Metamycoplasmataceae bacterium]